MKRAIIRQLRHQWGRAIGLVMVIAFATGSFVVLTASSATARLQVVGTVNANYQGAYDILVRPRASRTSIETERGLVRPNFLSGQTSGISEAQWKSVQSIQNVEVAAPIAMVGYVLRRASTTVDVTSAQRAGARAVHRHG